MWASSSLKTSGTIEPSDGQENECETLNQKNCTNRFNSLMNERTVGERKYELRRAFGAPIFELDLLQLSPRIVGSVAPLPLLCAQAGGGEQVNAHVTMEFSEQ